MWQIVQEFTSCCWLEQCDKTHYKRIKKVLPIKRGIEEVKMLKILNGIQGVPSLLAYDIEGDNMVFYMSYFEGIALDSASLDTKRSLSVFWRGLKILNNIHQRGIWHRDLCPRHILIDDDDNVAIIDFGTATPHQATDQIGGTLAYAAPEVIFNPKQYSDSSDLFAYTKSFHSVLASDMAVKRPELLDILLQGMILNPEMRFQTTQVFMQHFMKSYS